MEERSKKIWEDSKSDEWSWGNKEGRTEEKESDVNYTPVHLVKSVKVKTCAWEWK